MSRPRCKGGAFYPQSPGGPGDVEFFAVHVGKYGPEAHQYVDGNAALGNVAFGNVALQAGSDKVPAPSAALGIVGGGIAFREAAAHPQLFQRGSA